MSLPPRRPVRARAVARYVRMSPTKVRRVVALIKDRPLQEALDILRFSPQAAARAGVQGRRECRGQRREQPRPGPRHPGGGRGLRRRGPDAQAHPAAGPGPRLPDPQADQPHHRRGRVPSRPRRGRRRPQVRRGGPADGSEDQPARVPARHHHRLEVALVRRQAVRRVRQGGRRDPQDALQGHGAGRHLQGRDRAHPGPRAGGHLHRAPGHRDRPPRRRGRPDPGQPGEAHPQAGAAEHPRGQERRVGRPAGRAGRGRAAVQPGGVPPRDAQGHPVGHALAAGQGHPGAVLGPPGRRRDVPLGVLPRGSGAAAHAARRHRLRPVRGPHHVRPHRRQGVDLQG